MKLAFSSNAYLRYSIEETIARVAALGYTGIELLADVPHAWPAGLLDEQKQSIRDALAKHKLTISNINAFMMNAIADPRQPYWYPSWIEPDPHYRAIRREHTKRALHLAHDLGAPHITTEPGGPLANGQTWRAGADIFYNELMPCIEVAEAIGVPLLIEPEPGLLIERFDQYLEFVSRIDSPMIGLNFDVGHAYCVGEDPQNWIAKMQTHTRHYHVEDIAATRIHQHLVPGHGAIDFPATLAAIKNTGYRGWLTVELYPYIDDPDKAARDARQFLEKVLPPATNSNDWRLQGQEAYLMSAELIKSQYEEPNAESDHDHCEFCGQKSSSRPGDLQLGYCTADGYRWICDDCFTDFSEMFEWKVK